ncbi:hypothetical protein [Aquimarina sp. AU58]|uniref:hypothetical protein n=1 Tax=Aquimarina sp. AU58 TaxID=1874112 RepID=UPI000D6E8AFF|nr:hypothetical protein [Aquimarina sp. AU58]
MKIIRNDVKQANVILEEFYGFNLHVQSYSSTFNVIKIMIESSDCEYIVFINFNNCKYFRGKFYRSESELRISENNGITEINDVKSDFQIKSEGGFILKKGLYEEFFDDSQLPKIPPLPWEKREKGGTNPDSADL